MHKWYAATGCPGPYLGSKFPELAKRVTANLKGSTPTPTPTPTPKPTPTSSFFPAKGYWGRGDVHENVGKIASFMRKCFPSYTPAAALGNTFGPNLQGAIKEFQRRTGLEADGNVRPITLAKLKEYGFKEGSSSTPTPAPAPATLKVGDKIKIANGAKYTNGVAIPGWVLKSTLYCREIRGDVIVFSTLKTGQITGATKKSNVSKA
jgi:hypothetical protein